MRQVLAAHYLRGFDHIVEIGGAGLPITRFLTHAPRQVDVIDPKIEPFAAESLNGAPCRVRFHAAKLQEVTLDLSFRGYALVMLGLSLKPFGGAAALDPRLLGWFDGAARVVMEYPPARDRSADQAPALLERGSMRPLVDIDMRIADDVIVGSPFAHRRFLVLDPAGSRLA